MALQKQTINFPIAQGMDTKSDKKQLPIGKMELLQNAQMISPNEAKKRYGFESLASIENPRSLHSFQDEAITLSDNKVYTFSPGLDQFVSIKQASSTTTELEFEPISLKTYEAISNSQSHFVCGQAYHSSGVQGFVSNAGTNLYFTIIDYETKANLYGPVSFGGALVTSPKIYLIGTLFVVVYNDGSTLYCRFIPVNTTSGAMPSANTITSSYDTTNPSLDGCVLNDILYLAWGVGGNGLGVAKIDTSTTIATSTLPISDTLSDGVGICTNTDSTLSIAYNTGTAIKYLVMDTSFNITVASTLIETISNGITVCPIIESGNGYVYYEIKGSNPGSGLWYNNYIKRATVVSNALGTTSVFVRSVGIVSKPFEVTVNEDDITCIMVGYTGAQPAAGMGTVFLLNSTANVIGKLYPGNCFGIGTATSLASSAPLNAASEITEIEDGVFTASFLRTTFFYNLGTQDAPLQLSGYGVFGVEFNFNEDQLFTSAVAANNLHLATGILSVYDGKDFVEHNFNTMPEKIVSVSGTGSGGIFTNADVYQYVIVAEWIDAQGNLHQSAVSPAYSITAGANYSSIGFSIPTIRLTQKASVYLSPFRTEGNGTIFYRVGAKVSDGAANSTSADTASFTDTTADSTLILHDQLYTTGGVVDNEAVPSPLIVANYNNKLIVIPRETPTVALISKSILQGIPAYPVDFSSFLQTQINTLGGDCTQFVQIDDKGIFFKNSTIFYVTGTGPNDTLTQNDLSIPTQIPTDVGCVELSSVVSTPFGALFKSEKGIYLLDRSLNASYIGAEVEAYNDQMIVSADLIPNTQQVRFLLDGGTCLVFDYFMKQWFVYSNMSGVDAIIYQGLYTYLGTTGDLLQETPNEYSDNGAYISMKLKTGWLSFTGIQGFQRVWKMLMLGNYYNTHRLQVSFAFNFDPNPFQTVLFSPGSVYGYDAYGDSTPYGEESPYGGADNGYPLDQFQLYPMIQKCESIQITIEDFSNGENGESYSLSNLAFEVGTEGGLNRMAKTKKFG